MIKKETPCLTAFWPLAWKYVGLEKQRINSKNLYLYSMPRIVVLKFLKKNGQVEQL